MKLGDRVAWSVRSYLRVGVVVQVVTPGKRPWATWSKKFKLTEPGMARDVESYIVRCEGRTFWPRNGSLTVVS